MFIRHAMELLNIYDSDTQQALREELTTDSGCRIKAIQASNLSMFSKIMALGLITTALHNKDISFTHYSKLISRSHWTKDNLTPPPKENRLDWLHQRGFNSENTYIFYKIFGGSAASLRIPGKGYNIITLQCSQGHTNVQNFLKDFGYTATETTIAAGTDMKVITFVIENNVYFLINNIPDSTTGKTIYRRMTGWLPVLLKDAFKETLKDNETLYSFFRSCYDNDTEAIIANIVSIEELPKIKDLTILAKTKTITSNIERLESNMRVNGEYELQSRKQTVQNLEEDLAKALHALAIEERRQATSEFIKDKELLLQQCIKNPYVKNVEYSNGQIILTTYGPVDYDKEKIKKVIKNYNNNFIKVMTDPNLELYWESCCAMHTRNFTVSNALEFYHTDNKFPNTHWYFYNCFGNNKAPIMKALKESDYLSAIMLTITAAQGLNIYDVTVLSRLYTKITDTYEYTPIFYNKTTNKFITYNDAINL